METKEKKKIKIAIINDVYYPLVDGVVRVVDNYCRELNKLPDVDVTCVVPGPRKQEDYDKYYKDLPYKVLMCKGSGLGFDGYNQPRLTREFKRKFKEEKFDLIHCHSIFTLYKFAIKVAKKQNIPVVLTEHSQYLPDFKRYLKFPPFVRIAMRVTKRKLNKCDLLFAINDRMNVYAREIGFKGKSKVVRNATHFKPPADLAPIRAQAYKNFGIEKGANVFSFVGRLLVEKGVLIILDAMKVLKERGIPFKMFYVGSGFDEKRLRAEIEKAGLEKDVILTGQLNSTDKLIEIYSISKLFLFPSKFDVDCLVKREAASCLVPSVMLEDTYTNAEIVDGVNGYISTVEGYAEKIISAISDEAKRKVVAQKAKETLFWNWEAAIAQVYKIYKELLETKKQEVKN